jgi:hypothetical protein
VDDEPVRTRASVDRRGPPMAILVTLSAIVALVVLALVAVLAAPRGPAVYEPGSPEAAFQAFYQAVEARDVEAAYERFSPDVRSGMPLAEYRRLESDLGWQFETDRRVVLLGADQDGDRATLRLRIDYLPEGGLGAERWSDTRSVRMIRDAGTWLVDERIVGVEPVPYGY